MKFAAPTLAELQAYAAEINYSAFDPEAFLDYYEACGWVVGKARKPMASWRAAVRTWRRMSGQWTATKADQEVERDPAILDYARQAKAHIANGGYEIGKFWAKVRNAIGPDGLARVQRLARKTP